MYRLVYMSSATHVFKQEELEELIEKSVANNTKIGITGLLIVKGKTFLQCLEGEKEEVIKLYEKIENDDRHYDVISLIEENCDERLFPQWSMQYRNILNIDLKEANGLKEFTTDSIKHLEDSEVYDIFGYFID